MRQLHSGFSDFPTVCIVSLKGDLVTLKFHDAIYDFHAQWLYDAQCDGGPSRSATSAFCEQPPTAMIREISVSGQGSKSNLHITWEDGARSQFPVVWLRVFAPVVAKHLSAAPEDNEPTMDGWLPHTLTIPEVSYASLFPGLSTHEAADATILQIFHDLLHKSAAGIIKVCDLPTPNVEAERGKKDTIVTQVLKQIFGSVFVHPIRGTDRTFNVASHHQEDSKRGLGLSNYDTNQVLLPHVDHAHYIHPIRVQGWYGLEGESENTFVSALAVLSTMRTEAPDLFETLFTAPMAVGRVAHYYKPAMYQATTGTVVTLQPGFPNEVKSVRWHPHLTGSLLTPFHSFNEARRAHCTFQEIMRRDTYQLKVLLKPGDLYIWDNFRILHGRERVLKVPRTGVGQTVPEQVVADRYRRLGINILKDHIDEKWLIHMPEPQLYDLIQLLGIQK